MDIKKLVRKNIINLTPYSSARDDFEEKAEVYLDANENPFDNGFNRYPDPYQKAMKQRLSELKQVEVEQILLGNGSDEVLDLIFRAFCEPGIDNVVSHNPSYGMYPVLAGINNVEIRKVDLNEGFSLNGDGMLTASDASTKIFFVCSPNNPSGNLLEKKEIRKLLEAKKGLVVIDEAYIDFSDSISWINELKNYPNLIVCQTLSKAWGLAGLRIGMCFALPEIISILNAIKPPYNINALSQKAALAALNDREGYAQRLEVILGQKKIVEEALKSLQLVEELFPSDANFVLARVSNAEEVYDYLIERQIIVRNRSKEVLCQNCLRFTIGTPDENKTLISSLREFESKQQAMRS